MCNTWDTLLLHGHETNIQTLTELIVRLLPILIWSSLLLFDAYFSFTATESAG